MTARSRLGREPSGVLLDEALAVSVESIAKTYSAAHEARYRPAVSVFARWREWRSGANGGAAPEPVTVADEDEEEDDEAEEFLSPHEAGAALAGVSFDVRRGEAVGVSGSAEACRTVARILCGMTAPSSGRILVRGRVAPSTELATFLAQRETTARGVARRLAALTGPERRLRDRFVQAALELALGDAQAAANAARPSRDVLRRVAAAAAFDPTADVLVIDSLADLGDPDFAHRCRRRLAERLAEGAGVVITAPSPDLLEGLCSRVVFLAEGHVERIATTEELRREAEAREAAAQAMNAPEPAAPPEPRPRTKPPLHTSDEHATLRSFALLGLDGSPLEDARSDDWIVARIDFDIATAANVTLAVRLGAGDAATFAERYSLGEGAYVATLRIPPGGVPAGEYAVAVGLILDHDGERTKIGRRDAAWLEVAGDEEGLVAAAEAGAAPATPDEAAAPEAEWSLEQGQA